MLHGFSETSERRLIMWRKEREAIIFLGEIQKIKRNMIYDDEVKKVLGWIWWRLDYPFGKRLVPFLA